MIEVNETLTDTFEEIPIIAPSKINNTNVIRKRTSSIRADEESISSLATLKDGSNLYKKNGVILCVGTSKGSILIWSLMIDKNNKIKFEKLHEFKDAHGKFEVDDLQVSCSLNNTKKSAKILSSKNQNGEQSNLLSIGRDNKCVIWSLISFKKLAEINYLPTLNNDSNLRMKHARFSSYSNYLYTTFIPRIRGGGKDMSSYIERWSYNSSNTSFNYKLESKHRIKNTILTTIQCSKDGNFVCVGDYEGRIELFDLHFNRLINFKKQHSSVITDLIFYHDFINQETKYDDLNKLILTISIDRTLQCYKFINNRNKFSKNFLMVNGLGVCSINTFKFFFILTLSILFFCYFFTFIE